ncbi:hypothetical protein ACVWZ3_000454 [Bradyrhizobium sp. i1.3.6]
MQVCHYVAVVFQTAFRHWCLRQPAGLVWFIVPGLSFLKKPGISIVTQVGERH